MSGGKLERELCTNSNFAKWMREARKGGKARIEDNARIEKERLKIKKKGDLRQTMCIYWLLH